MRPDHPPAGAVLAALLLAAPLLTALLPSGAISAAETTPQSEPTASAEPVVTTTVTNAITAQRAEWRHGVWEYTRQDLTLSLAARATAEQPVLGLELRLTKVLDGSGVDLLHDDTNRMLGHAGRWWGTPSPEPLILAIDAYAGLRLPTGRPPQLKRIAGIVSVRLATGAARTITVPIDGPRHRMPVADTGLSIEVGRIDWGRPTLALPRALVDRLAAVTLTLNGREQGSSGLNNGDPTIITLPVPATAGDHVAITLFAGSAVHDVPFDLAPLDLTPLLGPGTPAPASNF